MVADCDRPPINKACGEGLMPDTLAALAALGVTIPPEDSFPFRGIRFLGSGASVAASFPNGCGQGVRRTILHERLIRRAEAEGVVLRWGARVDGPTPAGISVDGNEVLCRWIVGADGQDSRVRRWAGLEACRSESHRYAFRRHYRVTPWTDCMEIYWGPGLQLYVTPVAPDEICLTVMSRQRRVRLADALASVPALGRRLDGVPAATPERGAVTTSRRLLRIHEGRFALVGDASGSVDAVTGEGLCLAFRQAAALAQALASGDLAAYQAEHDSLARRPASMAKFILLLDQSPRLRAGALHALAYAPAVFSALLSLHVGALSLAPLLCGLAGGEV
jgi:flavin-dependent dehydrogenase